MIDRGFFLSAVIAQIDDQHTGTPKALYDRKTGDELWSTDHTLYGQTTNNQSHKTHPKTGQPLDPSTPN